MRTAPNPPADLAGLADALGLPVDRDLLELATTHRSWAYENGGLPTNERMEFLGDAVLGIVVTDALYRRHPDLPEGQLAKLRAAVVNARALADVSRALGVGDYLKLGRGEEISGGRDKTSILADALEAVIGAVYLDRGLDVTRDMLLGLFLPVLDDAVGRGAGLDWKTSLQELAAQRGLGVADYEVSESGPDHAKRFEARVLLAGTVAGRGAGLSKKLAEQDAAAQAWTALSAAASTPEPDSAGGPPAPPEGEPADAGAP